MSSALLASCHYADPMKTTSDEDVCHLVKRIEIRYARSPERTLRNVCRFPPRVLRTVEDSDFS